jgi:hypothetical protein
MADEEPDNGDNTELSECEEYKQEKRIITLVHGEQTVVIEGPDDLKTMAELAAYFWLLTSPAQKVSVGFSAGSTLVTDRADPYYEAGERAGEPDELG